MVISVDNLDGGFRCVKLFGRLDMKGTQEADPQFSAQTGALKQSVIVDMSGVEYIASVGIRMLITNVKPIVAAGNKMVIFRPQRFVEDVLRMAGVDAVVSIEQDMAKALDILKS